MASAADLGCGCAGCGKAKPASLAHGVVALDLSCGCHLCAGCGVGRLMQMWPTEPTCPQCGVAIAAIEVQTGAAPAAGHAKKRRKAVQANPPTVTTARLGSHLPARQLCVATAYRAAPGAVVQHRSCALNADQPSGGVHWGARCEDVYDPDPGDQARKCLSWLFKMIGTIVVKTQAHYKPPTPANEIVHGVEVPTMPPCSAGDLLAAAVADDSLLTACVFFLVA